MSSFLEAHLHRIKNAERVELYLKSKGIEDFVNTVCEQQQVIGGKNKPVTYSVCDAIDVSFEVYNISDMFIIPELDGEWPGRIVPIPKKPSPTPNLGSGASAHFNPAGGLSIGSSITTTTYVAADLDDYMAVPDPSPTSGSVKRKAKKPNVRGGDGIPVFKTQGLSQGVTIQFHGLYHDEALKAYLSKLKATAESLQANYLIKDYTLKLEILLENKPFKTIPEIFNKNA